MFILSVVVPPLAEQKAIAHILGTLDDKIELNRQMNRTLEDIARALFKSWFVDFDPVHAKARNEPPAGMDAATAALFPAEFEESEVGLIPKGWRVGQVSDSVRSSVASAFNQGRRELWRRRSVHQDSRYAWQGISTRTEKMLSELGRSSQANKYLPPSSVSVSCIATPGLVVLTTTESQTNQQG